MEVSSAPRIRVSVGPLLFGTALARILAARGYVVDLGGGPDHPDLAIVSELAARSGGAPVEIALSEVLENGTRAQVTGSGRSRRVPIRNLEDLLELIALEAPLRPSLSSPG